MTEGGIAVARAASSYSRRTVAANILVAVAALVLSLLAAVDGYLFTQWNFVTRMIMLGVVLAAGWIPVALVIIAVSLRPYWATFIALGVVGAAILTSLFIILWVPSP